MRVRSIGIVVGLLCLAGSVAAQPKEKGRGASQNSEKRAEKAVERVANEAIDAVEDELTGAPSTGTSKGMPPGLSKKDKMPPGLAKQGKTPPGWEHGRKEGWTQGQPKQESFIRRVIRGVFRGGRSESNKEPERE